LSRNSIRLVVVDAVPPYRNGADFGKMERGFVGAMRRDRAPSHFVTDLP